MGKGMNLPVNFVILILLMVIVIVAVTLVFQGRLSSFKTFGINSVNLSVGIWG